MSPKIVDKTEKRKQIGLSALSYFAENGIVSASMSQVAHAVGIGKGTIYEYFTSKDELIAYAMEMYVETIEEKVRELLDGVKNPKDRLIQYTKSILDHITNDPKTAGILFAIFQLLISKQCDQNQNTNLKNMFSQARRTIAGFLKEGFAAGIFNEKADIEAELIATDLIAYLDGILLHSLVSDDIDLRKQVDRYLESLLLQLKPTKEN
jgi:AcrR family transcriptional regulator